VRGVGLPSEQPSLAARAHLQVACHSEQTAHHLLALADPLGCQAAGTDGEERRSGARGDCTTDERLACTRGTEQEQSCGGKEQGGQCGAQALGLITSPHSGLFHR
jgi:hypothetical protein